MSIMTSDGEALATPEELAEFLKVPERTLAQWRYWGKGPKSIKVGRFVRYRVDDVRQWLAEKQASGVGGGTS
jgi:predicted DNA-binding transcriptional regulator AlpA